MSRPARPIPSSGNELDRLSSAEFVARLGGVFEQSPWVAEAVVDQRPFDSIEALHAAMVAAVRAAPRERQLALLRAHPELAGRRPDALSPESAAEQAGLGLDRLDTEEAGRFEAANARYRARFGFPFIIAVKGQRDRRAILAALETRLAGDLATEVEQALAEVAKIAWFRLEALAADSGQLTLHVLDTMLGRPAAGLAFTLTRAGERVAAGETDPEGRAVVLTGGTLETGSYQLTFQAGAYHVANGLPPDDLFFDEIPIRFRIADGSGRYHVPLILSRYGYTTYRGS